MIKALYLYVSEGFDPYKNLAIEKYLFDTCPKDGFVIYLWQNKSTVVIGANQNPIAECDISYAKKDGVKIARRLSGGGAVFHDLGNLNFTFICGSENYSIAANLEIIKRACKMAGIETQVSGRNDILASDRKFSGNAFYNSKGKSYHHGTLMIATDLDEMTRYLTPSKAKLSAKGVKSVRSRVVNLNELSSGLSIDKMKEYIVLSAEGLFSLGSETINHVDLSAIEKFAEEYSSDSYIFGKSAPYTISYEGKFTWGEAKLGLHVKSGIVNSATLYTDSMDWSLSSKIKEALAGAEFNKDSIAKALKKNLPQDIGEDLISIVEL